ncbi:STAS domain-containing protein [Catellatospora coxensis]
MILHGDVDHLAGDTLRRVAQAVLLTRRIAQLVVDLKGVTSVDDEGVAAIADCGRRAGDQGIDFQLVNLSRVMLADLFERAGTSPASPGSQRRRRGPRARTSFSFGGLRPPSRPLARQQRGQRTRP